MAIKNGKNRAGGKSSTPKMDRDKRRVRTMSIIFLVVSVVLILSMILSAVR